MTIAPLNTVVIATESGPRMTEDNIGAAESGLSEVDLEQIDCTIARSVAPREIEP